MSNLTDWRYVPVDRHDVVVIPVVWITAFLSVIFHVAMFWFWLPRVPNLSANEPDPGKAGTVLVTRLAPTPPPMVVIAPSPPPPPRATEAPSRRERPATVPPTPIAVPRARQDEPAPATPPPTVAPSPSPRAPSATDLASYIEAKRRERGEPASTSRDADSTTPPAENETERLNRSVAASLAPSQQTSFGYDPKTGGGVFELRRIGYLDAEFYFTGWDKEIGRRAKQLIEVRKGNDKDIREAIVHKMIAIIRDEVKGEFTWQSARLGRRLVMSARLADNAELEAFLMEEFFSAARPPR